jgi:predicted metal-dependent HD superfamily phosphohydrolase
MNSTAKQVWEALCSRYTADAALVSQLWEELEKAYAAKGRYYHTLDHLAYMLELATRYKQASEQQDLLLFAIFYHDMVYSPSRSDNEEKSAELAEKRLSKLELPAADIAFVKDMILATKAHQPHSDTTINFLLDLDLAILGADNQRYDAYSQAVRKEYRIYPDLMYKPGRRKVLQHFLAQPSIYKTPVIQQAFEAQARQNLQRELLRYT